MKEIICSLIWPLSCTLHVIIYIYASSFRETGTSLQSSLRFSCQISESFFHLPHLFDINFIAINIDENTCYIFTKNSNEVMHPSIPFHVTSKSTHFSLYMVNYAHQGNIVMKREIHQQIISPSLLSLSILFSQTLISLLVISVIEQSIVTVLLQ